VVNQQFAEARPSIGNSANLVESVTDAADRSLEATDVKNADARPSVNQDAACRRQSCRQSTITFKTGLQVLSPRLP
jgi:hypothetical protein